jgi:hypothetical protein
VVEDLQVMLEHKRGRACMPLGQHIRQVKQNMNIRLGLIVALAILELRTVPTVCEGWPAKTARIIVPFGAGATPDVIQAADIKIN